MDNKLVSIKEQVIFNDGELELNVSVNNETVWLNRNQISELFGRDIKTIGKHINNVFKDKELDKISVVANFATTAKDGKRYNIEYYNLDVIISIGYRVKSQKGVRFRQWATSVLKQYIQNGYTINGEKITHDRFVSLENDVTTLKSELGDIKTLIQNNKLETTQGIFYDGQVYDAYIFVSDLIKKANKSIVLVDNYIDESILTLLSKRDENISVTIYTKNITKQIQLDLKKYNEQYPKIELKKFTSSHDRFIILDKKDVYHIGASLKDLGKKWFAFSKLDIDALDILSKLKVTVCDLKDK
ncbi:MAG: RhuM family protein [Campylobacterota bacterium]|nr:RhuM family protein [Campylobacterota bacterium]